MTKVIAMELFQKTGIDVDRILNSPSRALETRKTKTALRRLITAGLLSLMENRGASVIQEKRQVFVRRLITQGIFEKVEIPGNAPRLWVTSAFHSLDFVAKELLTNVVHSYYATLNPDYHVLFVYDAAAGRKIGAFYDNGLHLD